MNTNRREFVEFDRDLPSCWRESNSRSFVSIRGSFLAGFLGNSAKRFQFELNKGESQCQVEIKQVRQEWGL